MVFCSYREAVLEIVVRSVNEKSASTTDVQDMLNEHSGILSATKFVGQSQGKQEIDKGFNQKEQKKASSSPILSGLEAERSDNRRFQGRQI
jgi:ATP-dependent DNA helicase MPH1